MKIVALGNEALKEEFLYTEIQEGTQIDWIVSEENFLQYKNADAFFDLLFQPDKKRIEILKSLEPKPVFINDVSNKKPADASFIRFNGWPTFLKRKILEASCDAVSIKSNAEKIINALGRKVEWVPDIAGFITARVLAMIINEAFFALGEKVSSKKDIDIAMKLGTNYPFGPFEWGEKIGFKNIHELLTVLGKINSRYEPAALLTDKAFT